MSGAVAFGGLLVLAVLAGRYGRGAAVLLAVAAVGSLFMNGSMEGRVLYSFSDTHGHRRGRSGQPDSVLASSRLVRFPAPGLTM